MKFTKKFRNLSIRVKVALVTAVLLAVGFLCLVTASSKLVRERVTSSMQDQFINETMQIGDQLEALLATTEDVAVFQNFIDTKVSEYDYIAYGIVIDKNVTAIAHSDHIKIGKEYGADGVEGAAALREEIYIGMFWADVQQSWTYDVIVPVYKDGALWGAVNVGIYCDTIDSIVSELENAMLIISIVLLLVVIGGVSIVLYISFRPLDEIESVCHKMEQGDLTASMSSKSLGRYDEIGKIAQALNNTRMKLADLISETVKHTDKLLLITDGVHTATENTQAMATAIAEKAGEVAVGCGQQSQLTTSNVSMTEEITKGMEEISGTIMNVSNTASVTAEEAQKGNEKLDVVVNQINDIESKVRATHERIGELDKMSNNIQTVVQLISNISSQTNLLALNASIEAARAGEHGRGFAVVASEVSQLADQSKDAADEISSIITDIQACIRQCVSQMEAGAQSVETGIVQSNEAKETFKEILQHINIVSEEMTNVSAVTEEVNSGSSMLLEAIISINDIAGEVTQKTEDGLHASNDQKQMVTNIMNQVEELNAISSEIQASINAFII